MDFGCLPTLALFVSSSVCLERVSDCFDAHRLVLPTALRRLLVSGKDWMQVSLDDLWHHV